ncbi:MAG: hypothetical protein KC503_07900, partial [Myxococcales bacterium]|nr:hypothetical protein [Myxococcales bacterium]
MKRHALITLLLLAIALTPATSHARAVHVVRVDGPRVSARDVLGAGVAAVDLGMAPQPGFRRRIEATRLRRLVPGAKTAARAYLVETRAQTLGCATLRARVSAALSLPAGLRVVRLDCARGLTLAAGAIRVGAELVGQRQIGAVLLRVTLRAGRWPAQQRVMSARVDGRVRVAMTVRAVGRGEALASSVEGRMARVWRRGAARTLSPAEVQGERGRAGLCGGVVRGGG